MSYTNTWSDTIPLGSEAASHIDDAIRQLRLDVHERMTDLVIDWTADPVVLQTAGASGDNSRYIPPTAFFSPENGLATPNNFIVHQASDGIVTAPLSAFLPFNATITRIKYWIDRGTTSVVTLSVRSIPFAAGSYVNTDVAATIMSTSTGGIQTLDTGVISVALNSSNMYDIGIIATGGATKFFSIYGVFIAFTT